MIAPRSHLSPGLRGPLLRLAAAALVVGLGLLALWQAGLIFESETAPPGLERAALIDATPVAGRSVGLREGNIAPDFEFSSFDGRRVRLSELRGTAVVLNFWASWCTPCKAEMPDLEALLQRTPGLSIVGVNNGERYENGRRFLDQVKVRFTAFAYDPDATIAKRYSVQGMPTTYFIDAAGVITRVIEGAMAAPVMASSAAEALAGAPPPRP